MIFLQTYALLIGSANCRADAMSLAFLIKPNLHLAGLGTRSFLCLGIMQIPMHFLSIAFRLDCSFGRQHHPALYARIFGIFFSDIWQTPHTTTVPSRFSDLPWRKSASGAFFVPGLFFCWFQGWWEEQLCQQGSLHPLYLLDQWFVAGSEWASHVRFPSTKIFCVIMALLSLKRGNNNRKGCDTARKQQ